MYRVKRADYDLFEAIPIEAACYDARYPGAYPEVRARRCRPRRAVRDIGHRGLSHNPELISLVSTNGEGEGG